MPMLGGCDFEQRNKLRGLAIVKLIFTAICNILLVWASGKTGDFIILTSSHGSVASRFCRLPLPTGVRRKFLSNVGRIDLMFHVVVYFSWCAFCFDGCCGSGAKTVKKHFGSCHLMMKSRDKTSGKKTFFQSFLCCSTRRSTYPFSSWCVCWDKNSHLRNFSWWNFVPSSRESDDVLETKTIKRVNFSSHFIAELRLSANSGCHCDEASQQRAGENLFVQNDLSNFNCN